MHGIGIGRRMHGDGMDAHLAAGAMDAERNFTPVGDENFFEQGSTLPLLRLFLQIHSVRFFFQAFDKILVVEDGQLPFGRFA